MSDPDPLTRTGAKYSTRFLQPFSECGQEIAQQRIQRNERWLPRFAAFPCQRRTHSGDITRPDRKPAPSRPCQIRDT